MPNLKKYFPYVGFFLLAGCLNDVNVAGELSSKAKLEPLPKCYIPREVFNDLPEVVLQGVDTADLKSFEFSESSHRSYRSEIGGAIIQLELIPVNNFYTIKRSYKEPGEADVNAIYEQVCINDKYIFGSDTRGLFTKNGILWLELNSGNEFISSDLWIYMDKK